MNKINKMNTMNRKGQLAFLLIVVVALALVIITLINFVGFSSKYEDVSSSDSQMLSKIDFGEKYVVSIAKVVAKEAIVSELVAPLSLKGSFMDFAAKRDYQIYEAGNFFGKVRTGDFDFGKSKDGSNYVLQIKGLFVRGEVGNNEMIRNFDLCMVFDLNGGYIKDCQIEAKKQDL